VIKDGGFDHDPNHVIRGRRRRKAANGLPGVTQTFLSVPWIDCAWRRLRLGHGIGGNGTDRNVVSPQTSAPFLPASIVLQFRVGAAAECVRRASVDDDAQSRDAWENAVSGNQGHLLAQRSGDDPQIVFAHLERQRRLQAPGKDRGFTAECPGRISAKEAAHLGLGRTHRKLAEGGETGSNFALCNRLQPPRHAVGFSRQSPTNRLRRNGLPMFSRCASHGGPIHGVRPFDVREAWRQSGPARVCCSEHRTA